VSERGRPSRRRFLAMLGGGAAGVVAGGAAVRHLLDDPAVPAVPATTPTTGTLLPPPTVPEPEPVEARPAPPAYGPVEGETEPVAKLVAARAVEALTTYGAGASAAAVAAAAEVLAPGVDPARLAAQAGPLLVPGAASTGSVVYPQLGGLDPHSAPVTASVMVVVDQHLEDDEGERQVVRCVDVRVGRHGDTWLVEAVADPGGEPAPRPDGLPEAAARVLDHDRIDLPDSARWDVHDGVVQEPVLAELAGLADVVPVAVTCFRRGHPEHVFGTTRRSGHMAGLAVDIWRVGDLPVVQQQPGFTSLLHTVTRQLHESGRIGNLGSPWAFDPAGGRSFTDPVHLDHLHLGITGAR
jgi:hypothetical protein